MKPFPVRSLPPLVRAFVEEVANSLTQDPAAVATPALAAMAGAIGRSRSVMIREDFVLPCVVWAMISMPSGAGKTPILRAVLGHLRKLQESEFARYSSELDEYENDPDSTEAPVKPRRLIFNDATIESVCVILSEHKRGLLYDCDEASQWLGGFDKYRASGAKTDRSFWIQCFDGNGFTSDRKTTGTTHIPYLGVSVSAAIQPKILKQTIREGDEESGLLPRVLICEPPNPHSLYSENGVGKEIRRGWERTIDTLLSLEPQTIGNGPESVPVPLSAEAKEMWVVLNNEAAGRRLELISEEEQARWAKWIDYAARIALVFELATRVDEDSAPKDIVGESVQPPAGEIRGDCMRDAIQVVLWFAHEHYRLTTRSRKRIDHLAKLAEMIREAGGTVSVRDVMRGDNKKYPNAESAEHALDLLERKGLGHWIAAKGRQQRRRFRLES